MTSVDNRVVNMQFNASSFISNIQKSQQALDQLDDSLKLQNGVKGINDVQKGLNSLNLGVISDGVSQVEARFDAFGVMAFAAIERITNAVIDLGQHLVSDLVFQPVQEGFAEYEQGINSVQTIMNNVPNSMEEVQGALDKLNVYADKTIYKFSDMTGAIAKFTVNGVGLDESVNAIQGVANAAALAGASTQQASSAYYNFSQALGVGYMGLLDWRSISLTAGMATEEFKQQMIDTAVEMGTLRKEGEKYIPVTEHVTKANGEAFDAMAGFNESLSARWMTSDVLVKVLGDYADETTELGQRAYKAATEVKTFTQLVDTLSEAMGTGWATSFNMIIGDYEKATELWTGVSDVLGGMINAYHDTRNEQIQLWADMGGRDKLIDGLSNAFHGLLDRLRIVGDAFNELFPPDLAGKMMSTSDFVFNIGEKFKMTEESAEKFRDKVSELSNKLREFLESPKMIANLEYFGWAFSAIKDRMSELGGVIQTSIAPAFKFLEDLFSGLSGDSIPDLTGSLHWIHTAFDLVEGAIEKVTGFIGKFVTGFKSAFAPADGLRVAFTGLKSAIDLILQALGQFLPKIDHTGTIGAQLGIIFGNVATVLSGVLTAAVRIATGVANLLFAAINKIAEFLNGFSAGSKFVEFLRNFTNKETVDGAKDLANNIADAGAKIRDFLRSIGSGTNKVLKPFTDGMSRLAEAISSFAKSIMEGFQGPDINLDDFDIFSMINDKLKNGFLSGSAEGGIGSFVGSIGDGLLTAFENISGSVGTAIGKFISNLTDALGEKELTDVLGGAFDVFSKGAGVFFIANLTGFVGGLKDITKKIGSGGSLGDMLSGFLGGGINDFISKVPILSDAMDMIKGSLEAWQASLKADAIFKIALALGVLALSIVLLGNIDGDALAQGLLGISLATLILVAAMNGIAALPQQVKSSATAMLIMAGAMLVLSFAIKTLASIDGDSLAQGLIGMALSMLIMVAACTALAALEGPIIAGAAAMLIMAIALGVVSVSLLIFSAAIAIFGSMGADMLVTACGNILSALLTLAMGLTAMILALPGAAALLVASVALIFLGGALAILSMVGDVGVLGAQILLLLTAMALGLTAMIVSLPGAVALIIAAAALLILVPALIAMQMVDMLGIAIGLGALLTALAVGLTEMIVSLPGAVALIIAAAALLILAPALIAMQMVDMLGIAIGIGALLTALAVGLTEMIVALPGALALILAAVALTTLAPILMILSTVPLAQIAESLFLFLTAIAGGLTLMIVALPGAVALLITAAALLVMSGILAILGAIDLAAIGQKISDMLFAILGGLIAFAAGTPGVAVLVAFAASMAILIPLLLIFQNLNMASIMMNFTLLSQCIMLLGVAVGSADSGQISELAQAAMLLSIAMTQLSSAILLYCSSIQTAASTGNSGVKTIIAGIMELGTGTVVTLSTSAAMILTLMTALIKQVESTLDKASRIFLLKISTSGLAMQTAVLALILRLSSYRTNAYNAGVTIASGFANGLGSRHTEFYRTGEYMAQGYIDGIRSKNKDSYLAGFDLGDNSLKGTQKSIESRSPSKKAAKLGEYYGMGYVGMLKEYADKAYTAGSEMGKKSVDGLGAAIDLVSLSDLDANPVIRPVLDLDDIRSGASEMSSLLTPVTVPVDGLARVSNATSAIKDLGEMLEVKLGDSDSGKYDGMTLVIDGAVINSRPEIENAFVELLDRVLDLKEM